LKPVSLQEYNTLKTGGGAFMEAQVLKDRVAIVTGASRGLGEGIARGMAKEGAIAVLFSRNLEGCQQIEADIRKQGQRAASFKVDVTNVRQVNEAVKAVVSRYGTVDILVNNAAIAPSLRFLEISDEIRDSVIDVNLKGVWNCTRAVLPAMIKQKYGKIVNISSVTGPFVTSKGMTIYAATKGAVSALTRTLALELAPYNINVNAICPGSFDTPMIRSVAKSRGWNSEDAYVKHLGKEIPMNRLGLPEEIGDLAVFLASDRSRYITGTEIVIDGGNIIQEHKQGAN
jgi:NAD(P)-dependent dehydrogenase (short-subunit alcohol dehydrogenase family)